MFVYFTELPRASGRELDQVLAKLERDQTEIRPDPVILPEPDTGEPDDVVQIYLRKVAAVPPLSPGQEATPRQLVEANLSLVITIARGYQIRGWHLLDLCQEGNHGLIYAAQTFHPGRGYKFSTYAAFWAHRALDNLLSLPRQTIIPAHLRQESGWR